MSVGKKKRFEIFKRDKFQCQYCGSRPPEVVLECDHIKPRCEGGSDEYENLITSCFSCNRGKGGRTLDEGDAESVMAIKLETLAQVTAYNEMLRASLDAQKDQFEWLSDNVADAFGWEGLSDADRSSLKVFSRKLNFDQILHCAEIASSKRIASPNQRWRYFCGVCWGMIRDAEESNG